MNFITVTLFPAMFFSSTILLLTDYKCTAFEEYFDKEYLTFADEQMVLQLKKILQLL